MIKIKKTIILTSLIFFLTIGIAFAVNKNIFDLNAKKARAATNGTYYIAPDGKATNTGTSDSPWPSVDCALYKAGAGNTIIFKPGVYPAFVVAKSYKGTEAAPTILRSEIKWKAVIVGSDVHGIYTGDGTDWVIIDGFEVMGARYDGIKISGNYSTVRNNWVHNNTQMGVSAHNRINTVIENNLIEFNGVHIQFHHGIYADGTGLIIRNNIVRHNAGYGLHLYYSIKNSVIENNLIYDNRNKGGILVACPAGGGQNIIANNTVVNNGYGLGIWGGNGEVVANNIFSGNDIQVGIGTDTTNTIAVNNLIYNPTTSSLSGTGTVNSDPLFVDPAKGVFWLKTGSPAIGSGSATYLPTTDFWGHAQPASPYIGAFAYAEPLTQDAFRTSLNWYYLFGYGYPPVGNYDGPDYWNY